jgi:hypothetical protein
MADKMHKYNEKRVQVKRAMKGEAVPGTGHDTKKANQKGP